jgi:hypothetical protein
MDDNLSSFRLIFHFLSAHPSNGVNGEQAAMGRSHARVLDALSEAAVDHASAHVMLPLVQRFASRDG